MAGDHWHVTGVSVRGAAHVRRGICNQDAIAWLPESGRGLPLAVAAADGHGSAVNFRSEEGARRAVSTATTLLRELLGGTSGTPKDDCPLEERVAEELARRWRQARDSYRRSRPSAVRELDALQAAIEEAAWRVSASSRSLAYGEKVLAALIAERWKDSIEAHLLQHPFSAAEFASLDRAGGRTACTAVEQDRFLAYGATLLAVLVTQSFVAYLQLGDGEILVVSDSGAVSRPLPGDEMLFANETTSLCLEDAWRHFRVRVEPVSGTPPPLILIATDGYPNSFRDEGGFFKVASDLLEMIRCDGLQEVRDSLPGWLREASRLGSGDDISVGLICRAAEQKGGLRTAPGGVGAAGTDSAL